MKKFSFFMMATLLFAFSVIADNNVKDISLKKLPPITQSILKTYFPDIETVKIQKQKGMGGNPFLVELNDGTKLEFDKDGQWATVDCGENSVPIRMIPLKINAYLQSNHPANTIVKMLKDKKGYYEIHLNDGHTLLFDNQMRYKSSE